MAYKQQLYTLPQLYSADNKLTDKNGKPVRWFVHFTYVNPQTRKPKRFKVYKKLNSYVTIAERNHYATSLLNELSDLLQWGYNPFLPIEEQVLGEVSILENTIRAYIAFKNHSLRDKTIKGYRSALMSLLDWAKEQGLANRDLRSMTTFDLESYFIYGLSERKWAATTHNSELATIQVFFGHWQVRGTIPINPASGIKRLRERPKLHVAYNDEQMQLIKSHLLAEATPRAKQMYEFIQWIYYPCIRPHELIALTIGDIRWQTNTVVVPAKVSKSGRTEPVQISPGLREVIISMDLTGKPANWYIFGNQGKGVLGDYVDPQPGPKPVGVNYFSKYYRQVLQEIGIGHEHTLYGWKHTRNVHLWLQTKDLMRIMRHNRHTDPKVTMRYLRSLGVLLDTQLDDERRI